MLSLIVTLTNRLLSQLGLLLVAVLLLLSLLLPLLLIVVIVVVVVCIACLLGRAGAGEGAAGRGEVCVSC